MLARVASVAFSLAAVYVAYAGLTFLLQRAMIFPGRRSTADAPRGAGPPPGVEQVWLPTVAGRVEAWFVAGPTARGPAFLFAHGNAEQIDDWPLSLSGAGALGASLLMVEYPGYGRSEGEPSEASIRDAMVAAHDWLGARPEVDPARIVAFGRSLGGGAVCTLVRRRPLAALVLQSTFTGIESFARARWLPGFLVRDRFDNLAAIERFEGPVLVIHGTRDDVIPYAHGQALAAAARNGALISYPCAHNDCPPSFDAMWHAIGQFLRTHGVMPR